jgi:hypothetical protein
MRQGREARRASPDARSAPSPGGQVTESGMRKIMIEVHEKLIGGLLKAIRAEAARTAASPEFMRFLDSVMAKDFNHRTAMRADAR